MSIFDDKPSLSEKSSSEEMAALVKAESPAPAPPPEPTPEPAAPDASPSPPEASTAAPEPRADPRHVPAAALSEEREKRRVAEQNAAELKGRLDTLERMWQQPQQAQQQTEQPPDPDQDPIGALRYEREQRQRLEQHIQRQTVTQGVERAYFQDAQRFATQQQDFFPAYAHLIQNRAAELRAQNMPDQAIQRHIQQEEFQLAYQALQQGKSPAAMAYDLAKARGWQNKPVSAPTAAASVDPVIAEAKRAASTSISSGGAAPKGGSLSLDDITKLSGAAFDSAFEKYARDQGKRSSLFRT